MPELPDLALFAKNLRPLVIGREIVRATVFSAARVSAAQEAFTQALVGGSLCAVTREGKELLFRLESGRAFSAHLMLSGRFSVMPYLDIHRINAKIAAVCFSDGSALVISDALHRAKVTLDPKPSRVPDVESEAFTFAYLQRMARQKALLNVKAFLTDQKIMRGIGNAYADEILYHARISPKSFAGKIPEAALRALYDAVGWVLSDAHAQLARLCPDAIAGEERSFLRVHHPRKRTTEEGDAIVCEEVAKRRTYYTQAQRLYW